MPYDYKYDYLVICTRPKNRGETDLFFAPTPPSFNRWIKEWFKDLLIEDYDELEFVKSYASLGLVIPVDNVRASIEKKLQKSNSFECINVLLSSVDIKQDEFEVIDCYMA